MHATHNLSTANPGRGINAGILTEDEVLDFINETRWRVYAEFDIDKKKNKIRAKVTVSVNGKEFEDEIEEGIESYVFEEFSDEEIYKELHKLVDDFNANFSCEFFYENYIEFDLNDEVKTLDDVIERCADCVVGNLNAQLVYEILHLEELARLQKEAREQEKREAEEYEKHKKEIWGW